MDCVRTKIEDRVVGWCLDPILAVVETLGLYRLAFHRACLLTRQALRPAMVAQPWTKGQREPKLRVQRYGWT
jgi:hypothetical protein